MLKFDSLQVITMETSRVVCKDVIVGKGTVIWDFVNLYGCKIGEDCMIGAFVEIQKGVVIGSRTRIQSHAFICEKVYIGNNCFISHGVTFINDSFRDGRPARNSKIWESTVIEDDVSIGSNATIMPVRIGEGAVVGAGAVVIHDVPTKAVVAGNPARVIRYVDRKDKT